MQYFMSRWFYIFISVILVGPIEYTDVYGATSQEGNATSQEGDTGSFNIPQTIITIITTVIALFFANYLLDWKRHRETRPVLKIKPAENPTTYENDYQIPMYNITPTTTT